MSHISLARRHRSRLHLEELESRTTPAVLSSPTTLVYTDVDGDRVAVQVSKGTLDLSDFQFAAQGKGEQLRQINLGVEFAGGNLNVGVLWKVGDGLANVGYINAAGVDLGEVRVQGDLGRINAGDFDYTTPGLGLLRVNSLGKSGLATQPPGGSLDSYITGSVGKVAVLTDVVAASVNALGDFEFGPNGAVYIGGKIGEVAIGGSLLGGTQAFSGYLSSDGGFDSIKIGGDVRGGDGFSSGRIVSQGTIGVVWIGGALVGGAGSGGGGIASFAPGDSTAPTTIFIGGSMTAGTGFSTAKISVNNLKSLTVLGSIRASSASDSGRIEANRIGAILVGGNLEGTAANPVIIVSNGMIRFETRTETRLVPQQIVVQVTLPDGTVINQIQTIYVQVTVVVTVAVTTPAEFGALTVLGSVKNAVISAGVDGRIGSVFVGGDWIASTLAAGVDAGADGMYGTDDDVLMTATPSRVAKIYSVIILGRIQGTTTPGDSFGFLAQEFGSFFVGGRGFLRLNAGPANDDMQLVATGDVRLHEVTNLPPPPGGGGGGEA
jgi:hypothetical protein